MGYLIALGLLVAFCAALLSPYGRRLLALMAMVVIVIGVGLFALVQHANQQQAQFVQPVINDAGGNALTDAQVWGNSTATNIAPAEAPAANAAAAPSNDIAQAPVATNSAEDQRQALLRADEATGLVQWIGGKMFYCSNDQIGDSQIPRPDQLKPCPATNSVASPAATTVAMANTAAPE